MQTFKIKKNDTKPGLAVTLQYFNGSPVDLTNGSVFFDMGNITDYSAYATGLACQITGSTTGDVTYNWTGSADTGSIGTYWGEFRIVWPGSRMTLPSDHSFQVQVYEDYI